MKNLQSLSLGLFCLLLSTSIFSQTAYSGIFHSKSDSSILLKELDWATFKSKDQSLSNKGFKLEDLEFVTEKKEAVKYYALWKKDTSSTLTLQVPGWDSLVQAKRKMVKKGYLMTDIESYLGKDGRNHFICIWEKKKIWHKVWKLDTWEGLEQKNKEMLQQFLYLRDVEAIPSKSGKTKYLAIYHEGDRDRTERAHLFASEDLETFNTDQWQRKSSGYYMIDFESFEIDGKTKYVGVYQKGQHVHVLRQNFATEDFNKHTSTLLKNHYRMADIEVYKRKSTAEKPTSNKENTPEQN